MRRKWPRKLRKPYVKGKQKRGIKTKEVAFQYIVLAPKSSPLVPSPNPSTLTPSLPLQNNFMSPPIAPCPQYVSKTIVSSASPSSSISLVLLE